MDGPTKNLLHQRGRLLELAGSGYDVSSEARMLDSWLAEANDDSRRARADGQDGGQAIPTFRYCVPMPPPAPRTALDKYRRSHELMLKAARTNRTYHRPGAAAWCLGFAARYRKFIRSYYELGRG